jgi:hypothetical protein
MSGWGRRNAWGGLMAGVAGCALTAVAVVAPASPALAARGGAQLLIHPAWKIRKTPNATVPGGQLNAISCSAANACTAVGTNLSTSGVNVTLAERWNGTSWQRQPTPNPPNNTVPIRSPDLLGVSCPTSHFCASVGAYQVDGVGISLAEVWNGTAWKRQAFPVPAGSTSAGLDQVSCTSARFCEAVGTYRTSAGKTLAFAATWDGTAWRLQHLPNRVGSTFVFAAGVSCVSPTFCEATGTSIQVGPFAARWNGTTWLLQAVPGTTGMGPVSCVSATFCEALGSNGSEMWNGSAWSAQPIPSPAGSTSSNLRAVSCANSAFCAAVGQYTDSSGHNLSLAAAWNGTSWAVQPTPNPPGATFTVLDAVSCAQAAACEAGGDFQLTSSPVALAESWNGSTWQIQPAFRPPGAAANNLSAVSCASAVFCEAVGSHPDRSGLATVSLAEVWNGARWKIQKTPNPARATGGLRMSLAGVSCVSARFCEAVGSSSSRGGGGAEKWNGSAWSRQVVPGGPLTSVSCTSATFCMAAGSDGHVAIWNGASWSAQPSASGFTSLSAVSCASLHSCEAVGAGPSGANAEGWNGTSWSPQATPTPAGGSSVAISAVSCAGPGSCEAVGNYFSNSTFQQVTLAERWNGTTWTVQHTANPAGSSASSLLGVSCTSTSSCTAVGQYLASTSNLTLAEVWNGTAWHTRSTPNHPWAGQNILNGVSCSTSQQCTAAGVTDDFGQIPATLIETGD